MKYLGLVDDPEVGGTTLDTLGVDPIELPTDFIPVQSAQANTGTRTLDRDDDVRNRRAGSAPISFAATPSMTFTSRAWTKLVRKVLRKAMGTVPSNSGVAPAAIQSTLSMLQSGKLPALMPTLVREGQVDQMTGAVIGEVELNFPVDGEGTVEVNLEQALYHEVSDPASVVGLPNPSGMPDYLDTYMLRDITAYLGAGAGVQIDCLAGFGLTINNGLVDEFRSRFCAGKNISEQTLDGVLHRIWYPERVKYSQQTVTGRLDFGDVRPDQELKRILQHAEKLVVELTGPPLATTPVVDEMVRLILHKQTPTGGGAEPLQREGDQTSSYEFTAYLDDGTGKDLEAVLLGTSAADIA